MNLSECLLSRYSDYFPEASRHLFVELPVTSTGGEADLETTLIELPSWAQDLGVGRPACLLVPACCNPASSSSWKDVDWWRAAFLMMICHAEQMHERAHDPVHSYAHRLPASMNLLWERAWVNRIFLFLRRWVAHRAGVAETELLGKKPGGTVYLTHDVDYVSKTLALRIKQSAFIKFNLVKSLLSGQVSNAAKLLPRLVRFGLAPGDYWQFPLIRDLESEHGFKSSWNFYGGVGGFRRTTMELLLDPAYRVADPNIRQQLKALHGEGNRIGLHQGFFSWQDAARMREEKTRIEQALDNAIDSCRQHWLRFSFSDTWKAQEAAGFRLDSTLGFNDRSGFRNSAALRMPAWIDDEQRFSKSLESLPMVLMDSHLFDYGQLEADARKRVIDHILDEIALVGGQATVIWHHRVFHSDYGWGDDYRYLLNGIVARNLATQV